MCIRSLALLPTLVGVLLSGAAVSHLLAEESYPAMPVELVQYEEETLRPYFPEGLSLSETDYW